MLRWDDDENPHKLITPPFLPGVTSRGSAGAVSKFKTVDGESIDPRLTK